MIRRALRRTKIQLKLALSELFDLYDEPVFRCPVDDCEHTANYGRSIWDHLMRQHHDRVIADDE